MSIDNKLPWDDSSSSVLDDIRRGKKLIEGEPEDRRKMVDYYSKRDAAIEVARRALALAEARDLSALARAIRERLRQLGDAPSAPSKESVSGAGA